jgi:hypothetical protein
VSDRLVMPERLLDDGPIEVSRTYREGKITIACADNCVHMSEYNAWRALALLSFMLGVPLSKQAEKAIKL